MLCCLEAGVPLLSLLLPVGSRDLGAKVVMSGCVQVDVIVGFCVLQVQFDELILRHGPSLLVCQMEVRHCVRINGDIVVDPSELFLEVHHELNFGVKTSHVA